MKNGEKCNWNFHRIAKFILQAFYIIYILVMRHNYNYKEEGRMLKMDKIQEIRNRFYTDGENISQISEALNLDWKTVQKICGQGRF